MHENEIREHDFELVIDDAIRDPALVGADDEAQLIKSPVGPVGTVNKPNEITGLHFDYCSLNPLHLQA